MFSFKKSFFRSTKVFFQDFELIAWDFNLNTQTTNNGYLCVLKIKKTVVKLTFSVSLQAGNNLNCREPYDARLHIKFSVLTTF